MVANRTPHWTEAARRCKEWLDAKEEYDALLREHYPSTKGELVETPPDEDLVKTIEAAREREIEAHSRYRDAYFRALGAHD